MGCPRILSKESGADSCVVDRDKLVIIVSLLGMLAVVHVAQVVLLALEEDYGETIQGKSTSDIVIEHSGTEIEPLVVLASLR